MKILKILVTWYSGTGNTEKIAKQIHEVVEELGYSIHTVNVTSPELDVDILLYDLIQLLELIQHELHHL